MIPKNFIPKENLFKGAVTRDRNTEFSENAWCLFLFLHDSLDIAASSYNASIQLFGALYFTATTHSLTYDKL